MDKSAIKIVKKGEEESDFKYWQSQPPEARLEALEEIRREYNLWKYGREQRFQRVCSVAKRT